MTCHDLEEALDDFLSGDLAPEARAAFDAHLAACAPCRDHVRGYRRTIRAVKDVLAEEGRDPSPAFAAAIVDVLVAASRRKRNVLD